MRRLFDPDSRIYQILSTAASFIALNILWLLCAAPLLTAGASTAAMYTVTRKMARHEDPTILPDFFKAFKENFKKSLLVSLILLLPMALLVVVSSYVWPLLAWYETSLGNTLRNAVLLPLNNPPIALVVTALNLLPLYLLLRHTFVFLRISFLWLVAGFALTAFVNTQLLRFQFRRFTPEDAASQDQTDD